MVEWIMARSSRKPLTKRGVDLDAIICLDMAHQWRLVEESYAVRGPLAGCPRRVKMCMICGSLKAETVSWNGRILNRSYKSDETYLENSRKLAESVNDRRAEYRRLLIGRAPANACKECGMIHDSADCPEWF